MIWCEEKGDISGDKRNTDLICTFCPVSLVSLKTIIMVIFAETWGESALSPVSSFRL